MIARGGALAVVRIVLGIALACAACAGYALGRPVPASAHPRCPRGKYYSKRAKRCRKSPKKHTAAAPKPPAGQPTVTPGPVSLTQMEREALESINRERAEHGVRTLSTSPSLQAISDRRVQEMAAMHADYAGHDVYLDIKAAGLCTRADREISGVGVSQKAQEEAIQKKLSERPDQLATVRGLPLLGAAGPRAVEALGQEEEARIEEEIPVDPRWDVLAVAEQESEGGVYYVEDYAEGC
jgi:hypothetical protein